MKTRVVDPEEEMFGAYLKYMIAPRPIALVVTKNEDGTDNAAPMSFFNLFRTEPGLVGIGPSENSHTYRNIMREKEFVIGSTSEDIDTKVNSAAASLPCGVSELDIAGFSCRKADIVGARLVNESAFNLECRYAGDFRGQVLFGDILRLHIREDVLDQDGRVDRSQYRPVGRWGGNSYWTRIIEYELERPK